MTIYLDAVWSLNALVDYMLLSLTNYLCRTKATRLRLIFGSLFASLIIPIQLYFPYSFITTVSGKLIFSCFIVLITFKFVTLFRFIKLFFTFYFVTIVIGGGLIATYYLFEHPLTSFFKQYAIHSGYGDPISWIFVVIGFPVLWFFLKHQMDRQRIDNFNHDQLYQVTIRMDKRTFQTTGFLDTGNQLIDPLTSYPVILCDEQFLRQWFSDYEWNVLKNSYKQSMFTELPLKWSKKIRLVPFYGAGGERDLLMALKPDYLSVKWENESITVKQILIGIQFNTLTSDQRYHCLLHPKIVST